MIEDANQLRVDYATDAATALGTGRFKEQLLSQDPRLFATMAEAPLEDLDHLRQEVESFLDQLKPVA